MKKIRRITGTPRKTQYYHLKFMANGITPTKEISHRCLPRHINTMPVERGVVLRQYQVVFQAYQEGDRVGTYLVIM